MGWPPKPWQQRQADNVEFLCLLRVNLATSLFKFFSSFGVQNRFVMFTRARPTPECASSGAGALLALLEQ